MSHKTPSYWKGTVGEPTVKLYKCGNCETLARQRSQLLTKMRGVHTLGGAFLFCADPPPEGPPDCTRCGNDMCISEYTPRGVLCQCRVGDPEEPLPHPVKGGVITSGPDGSCGPARVHPVCMVLFDYEGPLNRTVHCPACNAEQTPKVVGP